MYERAMAATGNWHKSIVTSAAKWRATFNRNEWQLQQFFAISEIEAKVMASVNLWRSCDWQRRQPTRRNESGRTKRTDWKAPWWRQHWQLLMKKKKTTADSKFRVCSFDSSQSQLRNHHQHCGGNTVARHPHDATERSAFRQPPCAHRCDVVANVYGNRPISIQTAAVYFESIGQYLICNSMLMAHKPASMANYLTTKHFSNWNYSFNSAFLLNNSIRSKLFGNKRCRVVYPTLHWQFVAIEPNLGWNWTKPFYFFWCSWR